MKITIQNRHGREETKETQETNEYRIKELCNRKGWILLGINANEVIL